MKREHIKEAAELGAQLDRLDALLGRLKFRHEAPGCFVTFAVHSREEGRGEYEYMYEPMINEMRGIVDARRDWVVSRLRVLGVELPEVKVR